MKEEKKEDIIRKIVDDPNKRDEFEYKALEIPRCEIVPLNGRVFVIEVAGKELKSSSGLWLPFKMANKKDDSSQSPNRYFVVAWDHIEIPKGISDFLQVGMEVNPFLPEEATNWSLPRVIDWNTGNVFKILHYTELAGMSKITPLEVKE